MSTKNGYTLLIVESPSKAKTIEKYLSSSTDAKGGSFLVRSSVGHIRDIPKSAKKAIDMLRQTGIPSAERRVDEKKTHRKGGKPK